MPIHVTQNDDKYLVTDIIFVSTDMLIVVANSHKHANIIHEIMQKKILTSPVLQGKKVLDFTIKECDQSTLKFYSKPKNALLFSNNSHQAAKSIQQAGFISETMYTQLLTEINNASFKLYDESKEEKTNVTQLKSKKMI